MKGAPVQIEEATGIRIRELRSALGESQETTALRIGMSRSYFAEIESGKRNASLDTLARIFRGLDVSPKEFFSSPLFEKAAPKPRKGR